MNCLLCWINALCEDSHFWLLTENTTVKIVSLLICICSSPPLPLCILQNNAAFLPMRREHNLCKPIIHRGTSQTQTMGLWQRHDIYVNWDTWTLQQAVCECGGVFEHSGANINFVQSALLFLNYDAQMSTELMYLCCLLPNFKLHSVFSSMQLWMNTNVFGASISAWCQQVIMIRWSQVK